MKERPILFIREMVRAILDGRKTQTRRVMKPQPTSCGEGVLRQLITECCYGYIGDRLWVREDWNMVENDKGNDCLQYLADIDPSEWAMYGPWEPSIDMPRCASRIDLEIIGVRVERLQDISEDDVHAEGCYFMTTGREHAQKWFRNLWDSINTKRCYGWDANPWVWVIEFRKIDHG